MYFDSDEEKILKMIELCRDTGIDTVVLDDGWYGRRKDENGSLGDWYVNREKFPQGFKKILSACKKNNMGLGVWIEPEAGEPQQRALPRAPRLVHFTAECKAA